MARQLNSSHPLFGNIVSCVGVDDDGLTVKDFADPTRAVTPHANVTIGTGTYGYHVQTSGDGTQAEAVSLSPTVKWGTTSTGGMRYATLIMVLNGVLAGGNAGVGKLPAFLGSAGGAKTLPWVGVDSSGNVVVGANLSATVHLTSSSTAVNYLGTNTPLALAVTRNSETSAELYIGSTLVNTLTGALDFNDDGNYYSQIGGFTSGGYGYRPAQVVWTIAFNKVLTQAEIAEVYNSLGANNQIGLLSTGAGPAVTPVSFSGPVADQIAYTNDAFSLDLSTYFSGNGTPFSHSLQTGTLPATLSLGSTGILSGTPTATGSYTGLVVRATDTGANIADTNAFSITVNEVNPNPAPTFTGPNIGPITVTQSVAMTSIDVSNRFSDTDTLTYSSVGTWPTGVSVSSSGLISGTAQIAAGTYSNLRVRATDTASQSVDSDLFSITVQEQSGVDGVITTEPLRNNTGTLLANKSGITAHVYTVIEGALVTSKIGLMSDAGGLVSISDPSIVSGTEYRVVLVMADGSEGLARYTSS